MRQRDGVISEAIYYDVVHMSSASTYEADAVIGTTNLCLLKMYMVSTLFFTKVTTSYFCREIAKVVVLRGVCLSLWCKLSCTELLYDLLSGMLEHLSDTPWI